MNATRKTRACTIDGLDEELKAAIRTHGKTNGLEDIETDILMCCETITVHPKKGFFGGIQTMLSAVYVTPKWLVWAESSGRSDVAAGTALLSQIDMTGIRTTTQYAIQADQGLNITGYYTDKNRLGFTFIVLDADVDGQKFRRILDEALRNAAREIRPGMI